MLEDELFAYLCLWRKEYRADHKSFLRRLRSKFPSLGWLIIVAVEDVLPVADSAELSPLVMAYASWERIEAEQRRLQGNGRETGDKMVEWLVHSHLIQEHRQREGHH
jgi:hypothetical protein